MKKLVELIKIGKSEHKRSDLISSYFSFIDLLNEKNENNNVVSKSWSKDNKEICELFSKNEIYFNKKCSNTTKVGREKSLFKSLNLITKNDIIEPTEFAKKIIASEYNDENEVEKIKLNNYEYNFLLIILFIENQSPENNTFRIIELILNNEEYLYKIDKDLYNEFKNYDNDKFEDELYEVIRFRSGSKRNCLKNDEIVKYSESKNEILKLWLKTCLNNSEDNINNLIDTINKYQICFGQNSHSYLKDALTFLIAGENKNNQKKLHKYITNKKTVNSIIDLFPKTKEEILDRCILRVIKGSEKDYLNLTHQHLNWLPYFYIDNKDNKIKIFNEYKSLIKQIIENKEKLISIFKNNNYIEPKEFISILNIENIEFIEHNEEIKSIYLNEYGNKEKLNKILDLFILNNYISEDQMRLTVNKFIQNSKHIQGICNAPTFYEFIISLSVMFKVLPNIFDKNADEFTQIIRKSLNLTFSNKNLIPQRFAAGGRPDAIIETSKGSIIVEPTLQIYRQTKAEADSVADHMNKFVKDNENVNLINTFFVSPKIEKRIISTFDGWYEDKIIYNKVETFNQKSFINYINTFNSKI